MAKDYQRLWNGVASTTGEGQAVRTLAEILTEKEGRTFISCLERKDAELCIEILDHGIAKQNLKSAEKQAFFVTLRRLAGRYGRLPDSMIITGKIEVSDKLLASGGYADVRSGTYLGHPVAVKTLRVREQDDCLKIRRKFCKEVVLWNTLSHPNLLKLAGVQGDMEKGQFVTVSERMAHGSIMEFIKKNHVNRLELLHGAAKGLKYLHDANLTHGDLKGANILVSNGTPPRACLADFGFMTMVLDPDQPMSCSAQFEGGTMTFMSPELLVPSKFGTKCSVPTPEADIYGFGLVIFQVLTGGIPFRGIRQTQLGFAVVERMCPAKPENASAIGFSDLLWSFVQRCWDDNVTLRPKVAEVVAHLEQAAADWDGLMPPCVQAENVASDTKEEMSDSMEHCVIFQSSSNLVPESPTESQISSGPFSRSSTPSTQCSELPEEDPQEVVTKPLKELPLQSEEPHDDLHMAIYSHLTQNYEPPPTQLPQKKRKGFRYFKAKLRGFFEIGN